MALEIIFFCYLQNSLDFDKNGMKINPPQHFINVLYPIEYESRHKTHYIVVYHIQVLKLPI